MAGVTSLPTTNGYDATAPKGTTLLEALLHKGSPRRTGALTALAMFLVMWLNAGWSAFSQESPEKGAASLLASPVPEKAELRRAQEVDERKPPLAPIAERAATPKSRSDVKVLDDKTFRQFSEWLQTQDSPAYNMISVSLDGEADGDRAELKAKLAILVNREEEWVAVPLRLNQAYLLNAPEHSYRGTGRGEARPDNESPRRENGYRWWLFGKGVHTLTLPLSVPVEKNRLQLALPTPAAAASSLNLLVRGLPKISVKTTAPSSKLIRTVDGSSELKMHGLGASLDVAWQLVPDQKKGRLELQSTSLILVQVGVESIVLEAYQTLRAVRGSFDVATVKLPPGFELLDVSCADLKEYVVGEDGRATLTLANLSSDAVQVKWTLSAARDPGKSQLPTIQGLDVVGSRRQSGYLAVQTSEGYHVTRHGADDQFVHQVSVSDLRLFPELRTVVGTGQVVAAYRFLRHPFRLTLELEKIEPYYTAEPLLFVKLSSDRVEVEATFQCQVYRGALRELTLVWPAKQADEWNVSPLESSDIVEGILPDDTGKAGMFRVQLVQPRTRADGPFTIRVQGRKSVKADGGKFELGLPVVECPTLPPATLVLAKADNVETEFTPIGNTKLQSVTHAPIGTDKFPELVRGLNCSVFRIDSSEHSFEAGVTAHSQQIQTRTRLRAELLDDRILVRQYISYQVAYERMTQARLSVPRELADSIRFSLQLNEAESATRVIPSWGDEEVGTDRRARIALNLPQLGEFEIIAEYSVEVDQGDSEDTFGLRMPLVVSADAEYAVVQFDLQVTDTRVARINESGWKHYVTLDQTATWSIGEHKSSIDLVVEQPSDLSLQRVAIPRAAFWSAFDDAGVARTCAVMQCRGDAEILPVRFSKETAVESFWWDGQRVPDERIGRIGPDGTEFRLDLTRFSSKRDGSHLLVLLYTSRASIPFGWCEKHHLSAPEFPPNLVAGQTYWHIALPNTQHVFSLPKRLTPQFSWRRTGVFWTRQSSMDEENVLRWVAIDSDGVFDEAITQSAAVSALRGLSQVPYRNSYLFGANGVPGSVSFWSISRPAVVGLGAGLTFLAALLLIKVPVMRNTLIVLFVALAASVLAVWFDEPVKLLLQPAILGGMLAFAALLIDGAVKRRRSTSMVSVAAASGMMQPPSPSSVERAVITAADGPPTAPNPNRVDSTPGSQPVSASGGGE